MYDTLPTIVFIVPSTLGQMGTGNWRCDDIAHLKGIVRLIDAEGVPALEVQVLERSD